MTMILTMTTRTRRPLRRQLSATDLPVVLIRVLGLAWERAPERMTCRSLLLALLPAAARAAVRARAWAGPPRPRTWISLLPLRL
jgi:hypothetical protein